MTTPHPYILATQQIEAADLPATVYRTGRRLLDLAANHEGTISLERATVMELAATESDGTMRRHLGQLAGAGIIEYSARQHVIVAFTAWAPLIAERSHTRAERSQTITERAQPSPPMIAERSQARAGRSFGPETVIAERSHGATRSPGDHRRAHNDHTRAPSDQNGFPQLGIGLVGYPIEDDDQPTLGNPPPKPPINDPKCEALAVALLSEMGVAMHTVKALVAEHAFIEIRRQVFNWLPEYRRGTVGQGALVERIRKQIGAPNPDPDIDRELWNRYRTPQEVQVDTETWQEIEDLMNQPTIPKPRAQAPVDDTHDPNDPWRITVAETARQMPYGVLERAQAEVVGEDQEAQVWRIVLDAKDTAHLPWLQTRGITLLRRTLASCVGRTVRVDVVAPERVTA